VRRLLASCLINDPRRRLPDIGDVTLYVQDAVGQHSTEPLTHSRSSRRIRELVAWAAAIVGVVVALVSVALENRRAAFTTAAVRASILPPPGINIPAVVVPSARFALSPDGRRLAFVGTENPQATLVDILAGGVTRLWVQSLDGGLPQPVPGTEGALGPFWSPDGRRIGFHSNNKIKVVDLAGGEPITLADSNGTHSGTWNNAGLILFSSTGPGNPIRAVAATGGNSRAVTKLNTEGGETQHWDPFFLPDGRHFLYLAIGTKTSPGGPNGIYVTDLDSTSPKLLIPGGSNAMYADGRLFFLRQQTLVAQPFDLDRIELTGEPLVIAEPVITGGGVGIRGAFSVSQAGVVAYETGGVEVGGNADTVSQLVWLDRSGKQLATVGEPARQQNAELSGDEKRVAVNVFDVTRRTRDIWLVDAIRGVRTRLTFGAGNEAGPVWSPDAMRIVFNADGQLHQKASNGASAEETLIADNGRENGGNGPSDWSPDGRFVLFNTSTSLNGAAGVWVLPLFGDRKAFPLVDTPYNENLGLFSPDGKWVAYVSNESGRNEVYVAPFDGTPTSAAVRASGSKWQVSTAGGNWPRWRKDGREIFYIAPDNRLMVATVDGRGAAFDVAAVRPLFAMRLVRNQRFMYDVSGDGQRFLVNTPQEESSPVQAPITLLVNWPAIIRR